MDRMLYIAMTGAKQNVYAQAINNNNLANASTTGFRSDFATFRSMPVFGEVIPARAYSMAERPGTNFVNGPVNSTGRSLDVAVAGEGWLAVQASDGKEAYTRAGDLQVTATGLLTGPSGLPVLGDGGPITIPAASTIQIGNDGTLSILPEGAVAGQETVVGRLKLVNPDFKELYKGDDGLMRLKSGDAAPADAQVRLISASLEGSNVNVAEALVNMIDLQRQFEMQVKMMQNADKNSEYASQMMRLA